LKNEEQKQEQGEQKKTSEGLKLKSYCCQSNRVGEFPVGSLSYGVAPVDQVELPGREG